MSGRGEQSRRELQQVILYVTDGCRHCVSVNEMLAEHNVVPTMVNVGRDRAALRRMVERAQGQRSVPQLFIGATHVGGVKKVEELLSTDGALEEALGRLAPRSTASSHSSLPRVSSGDVAKNDTENERQKQQTSGKGNKEESDTGKGSLATGAHTDDDEADQRAPLELEFRSGAPAEPVLERFDTLYGRLLKRLEEHGGASRGVRGAVLVEWIAAELSITPEDALDVAQAMERTTILVERKHANKKRVLRHGSHGLRSSSKPFAYDKRKWVFRELLKPFVLNIEYDARVSVGGTRDASHVARLLQELMLALQDRFIATNGRAVDYAAIARSKEFARYRHLSMRLQVCDVSTLDERGRRAFLLNLYNALVIHAFVKLGPPTGFFGRRRFFDRTSYLVGGVRLSLDTIENGLLRDNSRPASSFTRTLPRSRRDPRHAMRVPLDARLHFALVCGAKSCPPIRVFSPEDVDLELQIAAESFCEQEVQIDTANRSVCISQLFKWYGVDFGRNKAQILNKIASYLPEPKRGQLQSLLGSDGRAHGVSIKYFDYDWDSNNRYGVEDEKFLKQVHTDTEMAKTNEQLSASESELTRTEGDMLNSVSLHSDNGKHFAPQSTDDELSESTATLATPPGSGSFSPSHLAVTDSADSLDERTAALNVRMASEGEELRVQ